MRAKFQSSRIQLKWVSRITHILGTVLVLIGAFGLSNMARADFVKYDKEKLYTYPSTSEDIILNFIKLSGVESPQFEKMVVKTPEYQSLPREEKSGYLQSETLRLNKKFIALNPDNENILIRLPIDVIFGNMPDRQPYLQLKFPADGLVYFPYYYGGLPVAVLINGIEDFEKIYLTEDERMKVATVIDPTPPETLVLELKPVGASFEKPVTLDGVSQFPLICNIVYIGIHNKDTNQVWGWKSAPEEEKTDRTKELLNLAQ